MDPRIDPIDVTVKRDEGVTLVFADDHVASFNLVEVRLGCPCADCRDLRQRGQDTWPRPSSPLPLSIVDASYHGAWGLSIQWNDGHSAGIYPFETFRRWSDEGYVHGPIG